MKILCFKKILAQLRVIETAEIIEVDREKIRQMCLMDDEFFNVCMDGAPDCVELILQIIMDKPDVKYSDLTLRV